MRATMLACVVCLTMPFLAGSAEAQAPMETATSRSNEVVLRPGDALRVTVWPNPESGGEFVIEETGVVYLPYLGSVRAAGIPLQELRERLREGYSTVIQNPVVTVTPAFGVTVLGAVRVPGNYVATPTNNLFDLVGMAGGFTEQADLEQIQLRRGGQLITLSAMTEGDQDIRQLAGFSLNSGDQLFVPARGRGFPWGAILTAAQTALTFALLIDRLNRN